MQNPYTLFKTGPTRRRIKRNVSDNSNFGLYYMDSADLLGSFNDNNHQPTMY